MKTNSYDTLLPCGVVFNLREIEDMNFIKIPMSKKLIARGELQAIKIGNKTHVSRDELLRFLESNTIKIAG